MCRSTAVVHSMTSVVATSITYMPCLPRPHHKPEIINCWRVIFGFKHITDQQPLNNSFIFLVGSTFHFIQRPEGIGTLRPFSQHDLPGGVLNQFYSTQCALVLSRTVLHEWGSFSHFIIIFSGCRILRFPLWFGWLFRSK